jgi:RNA polymerase sigma-70 factor, ECF subfamily
VVAPAPVIAKGAVRPSSADSGRAHRVRVGHGLPREQRARNRQDVKAGNERRASLRTWLYSIATNICLDMLRSAQRRARAIDLGPAARAGQGIGEPVSERTWIQPIPDSLAVPMNGNPEARSTLSTVEPTPGEPFRPFDSAQRELLTRYCAAFERHDITALVALLHHDATMSMPPFMWWLRGRDQIRQALLDPDASCEGARLVPTAANGSPAFWQMRPAPDGGYVPFALVLLDVSEGLITGITTYLDADRLLPLFDTAATAPALPDSAMPPRGRWR